MKVLLIFLPILVFAACSKQRSPEASINDSSDEATIVDSIDPSVRTNRLTPEKFFAAIYSDYEKAGRKNAGWDRQAKEFFSALAASNTSANDHALHERIGRLRSELQISGCEDPLVRYMILRHTKDSRKARPEDTNDWTQVALDLDASSYHQYWKFFSFMRAAQAHKSLTGTSNSIEVVSFRSGASDRLVELLKDASVPTSVVYDAVYSWLITDLSAAPNLRKHTYDLVEPLLMGGWGDTAEAQLIRGAYYVRPAWDARGGGWADTVSDDGWQLMKKRLAIARESLERSWIIKPLLNTALQMQWVELGDSRGRKEMDRWFNNAMELDPGNYDARMNKLNWLHVKWHGSVEEMLDFGKESLGDTNGTTALTLYEVHAELAKYRRQSKTGTEAEYWKLPGVWSEVKHSFETFFSYHPNEVGWRHNYALAAYKCEAWDDLRKQIKLLGPINYSYFGGEEKFDEMVRRAEEMGREPI